MAYEKLILECKNGIGKLTLNDPDALNATSLQMLKDLSQALDEIEIRAAEFRCLILTGAGRGFCAGANLQEVNSSPDKKPAPDTPKPLPDRGAGLEAFYHPILRRLRNLHCPLVTAINGPAAGVGFAIALMGDIIIAAKSAYFLQAFRRIGLVPDGGSTWLLPRLVGSARAKELTLLGEKLPADKALAWGLINQVSDDNQLMEDADAMAKKLADGPKSLHYIRELMWASPDNSYEEQLNMERNMQRTAGRTKDHGEGVKAFLEKRPAKFTGQ